MHRVKKNNGNFWSSAPSCPAFKKKDNVCARERMSPGGDGGRRLVEQLSASLARVSPREKKDSNLSQKEKREILNRGKKGGDTLQEEAGVQNVVQQGLA